MTEPPPATRRALGLAAWSAIISLCCLAGIAIVWVLVLGAPPSHRTTETILATAADLAAYEEAVDVANGDGGPPMLIPTGIYVESLQFDGPYTVKASGFLWQRYADSLPPDLGTGIVMPEAQDSTFQEIFRTKQTGETLIGWSFRATLRQQYDYARYPLDRQQVRFEMWPVEFAKDVYLTPDLASYPNLAPDSLPGLDDDVVLEGWDIMGSHFASRMARYDADFGIEDYDGEIPQPELSFEVQVHRAIASVIPSALLPAIVVLLTLFAIVLVIGLEEERVAAFDIKPGSVLFTCAALFLAVLVAHNDLRSRVQASGFVYLEWVYLLTYATILTVAAVSLAFAGRPRMRIVGMPAGLLVRLAYWPLILLPLLLVTLGLLLPR